MTDSNLRTRLIRLASSYEKGTDERRRVLSLLASDVEDSIGEVKDGPLEEDASTDMGSSFNQQENHEMLNKQESGAFSDGVVDEGPQVLAGDRALRASLIRLAHDNKNYRRHLLPIIAAYDKASGCEKLPEGPMRDNCEEKKEEGKKNDK